MALTLSKTFEDKLLKFDMNIPEESETDDQEEEEVLNLSADLFL